MNCNYIICVFQIPYCYFAYLTGVGVISLFQLQSITDALQLKRRLRIDQLFKKVSTNEDA